MFLLLTFGERHLLEAARTSGPDIPQASCASPLSFYLRTSRRLEANQSVIKINSTDDCIQEPASGLLWYAFTEAVPGPPPPCS
jgi:hypothetical protein